MQYNTIQHKITPHNTTQHNTTQHNTTQHNTTPHHTEDRRHHISITYVLDFKIIMYNDRNTVAVGNARKQP